MFKMHQLFGFYFIYLLHFKLSTATLQRFETIPSNHKQGTEPEFTGIVQQAGHTSASGIRHFIAAPNTNTVTISPLILESHRHELTPVPVPVPVQPAGFTVSTAVLPSNVGSLERLASAVHANPVLAALLISTLLNRDSIPKPKPKPVAYNTPEHLPPDPYVALLLSHYGRYIPRPGISGHGLYGYIAANNIHNTKPFGSYKIYEDST